MSTVCVQLTQWQVNCVFFCARFICLHTHIVAFSLLTSNWLTFRCQHKQQQQPFFSLSKPTFYAKNVSGQKKKKKKKVSLNFFQPNFDCCCLCLIGIQVEQSATWKFVCYQQTWERHKQTDWWAPLVACEHKFALKALDCVFLSLFLNQTATTRLE